MLTEKEVNKCFIYINGKNVDIDPLNLCKGLNSNIAKEFRTEIMSLLAKIPEINSRQLIKTEKKQESYISTIDEVNKLLNIFFKDLTTNDTN
jgi:hypothetical protein